MKSKLILLSVVAAFTFTSCEKCQDCEASYEFINGSTVEDFDALTQSLTNYSTFEELWNSNDSLNATNREYCDDELDDMKDFSDQDDWDLDGVDDIRAFYDCK